MREPLTAEALAAMRRRVDAYDGPDRYTATVDGIDYDGHWRRDIRRLLDEVERLNAEALRHAADRDAYVAKTIDRYNTLCGANIGLHTANEGLKRQADALRAENRALKLEPSRSRWDELLAEKNQLIEEVERLRELKCAVCGRRVAHLNHAGHVIGWGCADGEECKPDPHMPEPREEWAIRVVADPGGTWWYHHESNGEDPERDLAGVLEVLADGRDLAGEPVEHGPVSIVKRTVRESPWEIVKTVDGSEARGTLSERGRAAHFERCPDCGGRLGAGESREGEYVATYVFCGECERIGSETPREYQCPTCTRWAPWTDGELATDNPDGARFWCQTCGAESPLDACTSRLRPELAPPATTTEPTLRDVLRAAYRARLGLRKDEDYVNEAVDGDSWHLREWAITNGHGREVGRLEIETGPRTYLRLASRRNRHAGARLLTDPTPRDVLDEARAARLIGGGTDA